MTKIASDAALTPQDLIKLACYGMSTILSSPKYAHPPEVVEKLASTFATLARRREDRHERLTKLLVSHAG